MLSFRDAELYLKTVGEETRLQLLAYLTLDTFCVCELVELLDMSQPSISQHLRRLWKEEIILEEKRGRWVYYSLNNQHHLYPFLLHLISTLPAVSKDISHLTVNGKRILCE